MDVLRLKCVNTLKGLEQCQVHSKYVVNILNCIYFFSTPWCAKTRHIQTLHLELNVIK